MRYRLLGRTGLYVSELCLGTMTFGDQGIWKVMGGLGQEDATALVKQAFEAGVNFIDTANVYSLGESETLTGNAIKSLGLPRDELVVATKATGVMSETGVNARGQSRYHLMNEVDASLKRLQLDHIDLYQLHGFDPLTPLEEVLSTLNDLVRSGKVRYIGLCNMAAWQIMKGLAISERHDWARFESVQAYYTVAGRDIEREVVPLLQDQQLGLCASFDFPVVDKGRAFRVVDAMRPIAQCHQVSVARVALAWLLSRPHVSTVIIGAKTLAQLDDNLGATRIELSAEELKALDDLSALPPEYPGWMLAMQGQYRAKQPVRF
jgi:aryl-alcohol dehydrogenase-like predicted oxidoreductase